MLPCKVDVSRHSILGSVADFYQHQALEDVDNDKENEEVTLKLPPIFPSRTTKQSKRAQPDHSKISNAPTIPSVFSPMAKKNRRLSNMSDLARGSQIEKKKEDRKLQQLLKGDRIYATREERVLRRWEQQQKEWKSMKRNIAQKVGKTADELVITRAEEWREMVEEIDLMTKSIPLKSMSSNHWQHSLRKKTGNEETTHSVPVGNMFSGLYCKVTHNPRKPMKETVRKPRKLKALHPVPGSTHSADPSDPNNLFIRHYNLPGKGAASKHWRERSVTYQYRKRLHRKMSELKPNNLDELDGLEIVGQNMFDLDTLKLPSYSYERLMQSELVGDADNAADPLGDNAALSHDDASCSGLEAEIAAITGPSIECTPSEIILFRCSLHEEQTQILEMNNNGTTAMILRFENVQQESRGDALFLYPTEQFAILPGETKEIAFYFKPSRPGSYHLVVAIESLPSIPQKRIQLEGICLIEDEDKLHRESWTKQMENEQVQQDAASAISSMVGGVPEPDLKMENLPKSFCATNREHALYWHPAICEELQQFAASVIAKFRRRKRRSYRWDLSVSTLKQWLTELERIAEDEVIADLRSKLSGMVERAQQIPPPNPLYYRLCSNLLSDLALEIPRYSWRAEDAAKKEHETELKAQQTANAEDEESDPSTSEEWDVLATKTYQERLYQDGKRCLLDRVSQFENGIVDKEHINDSLVESIQSKLATKPQRILTFGAWLKAPSKQKLTTSDGTSDEITEIDKESPTTKEAAVQPTVPQTKCVELESLFDLGIDSIHSNSKVTIMTSPYRTWICSSKQRLAAKRDANANLSGDEEETMTEDTDIDREDEHSSNIDSFELFPILRGFNVVQVFCCEDMVNLLTDTGDVYCSLFHDLQTHQTEMLYHRDIAKITGSITGNKCVALSASGEVLEWSVVLENAQIAETKGTAENAQNAETENLKNVKEDNVTTAESENVDDEKDGDESKTMRLSEAKQLAQIDVKLGDIAISSSAYCGITTDGLLILWGDYSAIYAAKLEKAEEKSKKKKTKKPSKDQDPVEEPKAPYIIVKPLADTQGNQGNQEDDEMVVDTKYKAVVSCSTNFVVLDCEGKVYSFGRSDHGTLGLGEDVTETLQPRQIRFGGDSDVVIASISASDESCIAIDQEGVVWHWGNTHTVKVTVGDETEPKTVQDEADAAGKNEEAAAEEECIVNYVPIRIEMEEASSRIRKAVATNVGGFAWCS